MNLPKRFNVARSAATASLFLVLLTCMGVSSALGQSTVSTDRSDYAPGDTVLVTGAGWVPGEGVSLTFTEDPPRQPPVMLMASADGNGVISNREFVVPEGAEGVRFTLEALGQLSGFAAQTTFTDSPEPPPAFVMKWGSQGSGDGQFNSPFGVATDGAGNVYVTDVAFNRIQKFTGGGAFLTKWGSGGGGDGQFNSPSGVATGAGGIVYVVEMNGNRIQKFTSGGAFIAKWGLIGSGDGEFHSPNGVATDAAGNVYVADAGNNRIQKFTSGGTFLAKWGSFGSGDGQFNNPLGVATDAAGNVYVADFANNRIQKFTSGGAFIAKWGSSGSGDGQFSFPYALTTDAAGNLYVTDRDNSRVQKFTGGGTFLTKWGSFGSGDGQFNNPLGVATGAAGSVYVVDLLNIRIQVFASSSAGNRPPILDPIGNQIVNEETNLSFMAHATDPDVPPQPLTYSLVGGIPAGASINPANGFFSWIPTEAQGPGDYSITVSVSDNGAPLLSDSKSFSVHVNEVNRPPTLNPIANQVVVEEQLLTFIATATDPDLPANTLSYSLGPGAPSGAAIEPSSGNFTWRPTSTQGPNLYTITVVVSDNDGPPMTDSKSFTVQVEEGNRPPVLDPIGNQVVNEETNLSLMAHATDPDVPHQPLSYSLFGGQGVMYGSDNVGHLFTLNLTTGQPTLVCQLPASSTEIEYDASSGRLWAQESDGSFRIGGFDPASCARVSGPTTDGNAFNGLEYVGSTLYGTGITYACGPSTLFILDPVTGATTAIGATGMSPISGLAWSAATSTMYGITGCGTSGNTKLVTINLSTGVATQIGPVQTFQAGSLEFGPDGNLYAGSDRDDGGRLYRFTAPFTGMATLVGPTGYAPISGLTLVTSGGGGVPAGASIDPVSGLFNWTPTEAQGPGDYPITVTATDNGTPPLSDSKSFSVHVNEVDKPPVLVPIADQTVNEETTLSLMVTATDPDLPANTLSYSLTSAPSGATIESNSGLFKWTPLEAQGPGDYLVTVKVSDNDGPPMTDSKSFTVHVKEANRPPTLNPIADQTVDEEQPLSFSATATDPDLPANTLKFTLSGAPSGATIDPGSGLFSWTPTEAQGPGDYPVTVDVSDNDGPPLTDSKTFNIHVNEVNQPPVLAAIADQAVDEGTLLSLTATATDPDLPAQTLAYSLVSPPEGAAIDPTTGIFSWTPTSAQGPGDYTVTVRASDDGSPPMWADKSFAVHVNEVNGPPTLNPIANQVVDEETTLSLTATATDPNLPAQSLTYSFGEDAPPGSSINASTGEFSWYPDESQGPGDYVAKIVVSDDGTPPLSAEQQFSIHVGEVNRAPTVKFEKGVVVHEPPLPPYGPVDEGTLFTLGYREGDPDIPTNAVTVTLVDPPAGATLDAEHRLIVWTPDESQGPGDYVLRVRATDDGIPPLSGEDSVTIHVNEVNQPPVLAVEDQTVDERTTMSYPIPATDPDLPPNALTYKLAKGPPGATLDKNTGLLTWTPTEAQGPGVFEVDVEVSDNDGPPLTDRKKFKIHVNETNMAPHLSPIADQNVDEGAEWSLRPSAHDKDDTPSNSLTFSVGPGAPPEMAIDAGNGTLTWTPTEAEGPGDYAVTVQVVDNGVPPLTAEQTFSIHVNEVNSAPVIAGFNDRTIPEGTLFSMTVDASDPDIPANHLAFALEAGAPEGAAIDAATGLLTWTPTEAQGPGAYPIGVVVTDAGNPPLSSVKECTITVAEGNLPPVVSVPLPITVNEGAHVAFVATATDPDLPANTLTFSLVPPSPVGSMIDAHTGAVTWATTDNGAFTLRVSVDDGVGGVTTGDADVTVNNVAPTVAITGPVVGTVVRVGVPVSFTGTFGDSGSGDTHTAQWSFNDINTPGVVNESAHSVAASYTFTAAGVYMVKLTVTDDDLASGTAAQIGTVNAMVVVYDPNAGYVIGAGWINSPAGAYVANPALTGQALFGFVSKYKKGATVPDGVTEFLYCVGNLYFHSSTYDWLVVTASMGQFTGRGTINGKGDYGFVLSAIDGSRAVGGGPDKLRMRIWRRSDGQPIYDNQHGAPDGDAPITALACGVIIVQGGESKPGMAPTMMTRTDLPAEFAVQPSAPNPFRDETSIAFELPENSLVRISVFDLMGREVARPLDRTFEPGRQSCVWQGRDRDGRPLGAGIYFIRFEARSLVSERRLATIRKAALVR